MNCTYRRVRSRRDAAAGVFAAGARDIWFSAGSAVLDLCRHRDIDGRSVARIRLLLTGIVTPISIRPTAPLAIAYTLAFALLGVAFANIIGLGSR